VSCTDLFAGARVDVGVAFDVPEGETVSRPTRVMMVVPRTDQGSRFPVTVVVTAGDQEFQRYGMSGGVLPVGFWVPAP